MRSKDLFKVKEKHRKALATLLQGSVLLKESLKLRLVCQQRQECIYINPLTTIF